MKHLLAVCSSVFMILPYHIQNAKTQKSRKLCMNVNFSSQVRQTHCCSELFKKNSSKMKSTVRLCETVCCLFSSCAVLCSGNTNQFRFSYFFQFADQRQQTEIVLMFRFDPERSKKSFPGASEQISFLTPPLQTLRVPYFIHTPHWTLTMLNMTTFTQGRHQTTFTGARAPV